MSLTERQHAIFDALRDEADDDHARLALLCGAAWLAHPAGDERAEHLGLLCTGLVEVELVVGTWQVEQ